MCVSKEKSSPVFVCVCVLVDGVFADDEKTNYNQTIHKILIACLSCLNNIWQGNFEKSLKTDLLGISYSLMNVYEV